MWSAPAGAARPTEPAEQPDCEKCLYHNTKRAAAEANLATSKARIAELEAEIDGLRAQLTASPPTERDYADVERRMYTLARQEAAARDALAAQTQRVLEIADERDREARTAENLRIRLRALGHTP